MGRFQRKFILLFVQVANAVIPNLREYIHHEMWIIKTKTHTRARDVFSLISGNVMWRLHIIVTVPCQSFIGNSLIHKNLIVIC